MPVERYCRSAYTAVITALLIALQLWSLSPLLSSNLGDSFHPLPNGCEKGFSVHL